MSDQSLTLTLALAQANPTTGDLEGNAEQVRAAYKKAQAQGAEVLCFPELFLSGYPAGDLIEKPAFLADCMAKLEALAQLTQGANGPDILIGSPRLVAGEARPRNSIFHLTGGKIAAFRDKVELPNYGVFDDKRNFEGGPLPGPLLVRGLKFGVPVCEDLWHEDVVDCLTETGAEVLLVLNGSVYSPSKQEQRVSVAAQRIAESGLPLIYLNLVGGQDEVLFDGASFALDCQYKLAMQMPAFEASLGFLTVTRSATGEVSFGSGEMVKLPDLLAAKYQGAVLALRDYVQKSGFSRVLLGLSGGIDSALVAATAADALGAASVDTVMLPYHYTSAGSLDDAKLCARRLGTSYQIRPIAAPVEAMLDVLRDDLKLGGKSLAHENLQSRMRGTLLMALSNERGALLLTTGNKSEVAVGYSTLYGDMNGAFNPIKDLYKTEVFALARWRNALEDPAKLGFQGPALEVIPENIITKPPSAELAEGQKDEDSLPPYDLLDRILEGLVERDLSVEALVAEGLPEAETARVEVLLSRSEFKRFQAAPGPKLSERQFGHERRYPLVNRYLTGRAEKR